jgi:hypothetical protein
MPSGLNRRYGTIFTYSGTTVVTLGLGKLLRRVEKEISARAGLITPMARDLLAAT